MSGLRFESMADMPPRQGDDMCERCTIPEDPRYYDIESETYFTCADCACSTCPHLHCCSGQCEDCAGGITNE